MDKFILSRSQKKKKKLKITHSRDWFSKLDNIIYRLVTTAI